MYSNALFIFKFERIIYVEVCREILLKRMSFKHINLKLTI